MTTMIRGNIQDGYVPGTFRDVHHSQHKFEMYYGWKECQRLGIEYVPEPIHHSNIYIRRGRLVSTKRVEVWYDMDSGLIEPTTKAKKYAYPLSCITDDDKRKFRAAARRAAKEE